MYQCGILLLSIIALCGAVFAQKGQIAPTVSTNASPICRDGNTESQLLCGREVRLLDASELDLALIPGIGQSMESRLLEGRDKILTTYRERHSEAKALESIHGIGPKRAKKLLSFLSLD
jgi:hypothetical protein